MTKDDFFDLLITANLTVFLHKDKPEIATKAIKQLFAKAKRDTTNQHLINTINNIRNSPCVPILMVELYNEFNREI